MSIEYVSTRDPKQKPYDYNFVLMQGLAPDRGLYVPNNWPKLSEQDFTTMWNLPYIDTLVRVNGLFVGDSIPKEEQLAMANLAFSSEKFPEAIKGNIVPLTEIENGLFVQDLSGGPTAAFKDMALQLLGQHMKHVLGSSGDTLTLLGATSGDTGSAAEAALKGLLGMALIMLSPEKGMTEFQKAQMAQLSGDNIFNISVRGDFDAAQKMVKDLKEDPEFADLGAVNSINWARVAAQAAYYISGYIQAIEMSGAKFGDPVDFVVPTGNFGNVFAGRIAKKLGVPIRNLVVATNENNVLHELIQTGTYRKRGNRAIETTSPSMDITNASNYERELALDIFPDDPKSVRSYMETFEQTGRVALSEFHLADDTLRKHGFDSGTSTHADRLESIRWTHTKRGIFIDPHTADGITVARQRRFANPTDRTPVVCMSTARPVKFEETMREALGFAPERPRRFVGIEKHLFEFATIDAGDLSALAQHVRDHQA